MFLLQNCIIGKTFFVHFVVNWSLTKVCFEHRDYLRIKLAPINYFQAQTIRHRTHQINFGFAANLKGFLSPPSNSLPITDLNWFIFKKAPLQKNVNWSNLFLLLIVVIVVVVIVVVVMAVCFTINKFSRRGFKKIFFPILKLKFEVSKGSNSVFFKWANPKDI